MIGDQGKMRGSKVHNAGEVLDHKGEVERNGDTLLEEVGQAGNTRWRRKTFLPGAEWKYLTTWS